MKIVMICEFYDELLEYQENLLAEHYVKHGHQVTVIASTFKTIFDYYNDRHDPKAPERRYEHGGVRIIKLPYRYNILNKLRRYTPIDGILEEEKPDLIFVHDIIPNIPEMVRYVKRHPDCRMIMDYHCDYSNSGANLLSLKVLHGVIRKRILDQARPHLSRIFPAWPAARVFLREVYGIPDSEMELLPLGTDLEYGDAVAAEGAGQEVRRELGIPDDHFVIFCGGKFHPFKKVEELIKAMPLIDRPNVHAVIVGDVSEKEVEYGAMVRELAAATPNVHMVGWQDRRGVYRHMAAADMAVFPASQSVMWQQAIGRGLPLVLAERSDVQPQHQDVSYLNRHDNIHVMDPDAPFAPQIAEAVRRLIDDPTLLKARQAGARRTAEEILDWNQLIQLTLRFNESAGHNRAVS